ncbi:uncharacterized protein LOC109727697 isoform X1 [Ananas comosus]|uniref:Uncharacterized protein LOC109727697 isoform X1 n=1 Tax=Ananas comosus TaxID=4615 RepID=A0A6P5H913_ANACO|nr:uncharacterized protein LOC109727697 isoform X1 [Ananas comosus]
MDSNSIGLLEVYPQVKVRAEEAPLPVGLFEEPTSIIPRAIESLSLEGHSSSRTQAKCGTNSENNPPLRYEKSLLKSFPQSFNSTFIVIASRPVGENTGTNAKVSFISRPRAVLSSPDNDDLIGNQNRKHEGKSPHSKKQSTNQHLRNQEKLNHKNTRVQKPPSRANPIAKGGNGIKKKDNLLTK